MLNSMLELPFMAASRFPDRVSHKFRKENTVETRTFSDFTRSICELTAAFNELGINRGDNVGFFVNNRYEWSVTCTHPTYEAVAANDNVVIKLTIEFSTEIFVSLRPSPCCKIQ